MDAKHTPGPWVQHHSEHSIRVCNGAHESDDGCQQIAEAEIIGYDRKVSEANARLIAAAPELLEALERLRVTALQHNHMELDGRVLPCEICAQCLKAEAAIRKAKGE